MDQAWIETHYPPIHRAAWWMTGNLIEADDLAQQTFVVALDRWHTFDGRSEPSTWLFGILLRLKSRQGLASTSTAAQNVRSPTLQATLWSRSGGGACGLRSRGCRGPNAMWCGSDLCNR